MELFGIDGCRGGWVAAVSDDTFSHVDFEIIDDLEPLFARAETGATLIGIDVPIGLSDDGPRACDIAARRILGHPRASSVFPAPSRAALHAETYEEACARNRHTLGVAISRQCFGILCKIREVDTRMTPGRQTNVREIHPEVVFAILAGNGGGLAEAKRRTAGRSVRRKLLDGIAPVFDPEAVRASLGRSRVGRDDVIDAVACLVAARRIARGDAHRLPDGTVPCDARGLRMEILA